MAWTREAALAALESNDLLQLGMDADAMRRALHGDQIATYAVLPRVIFSDLTSARADSFVREAATLLQPDATGLFVDATRTAAGTGSLDAIVDSFTALRSRFPRLRLHGLSAVDILRLASGQSHTITLQRLQAAGLASLEGGGAGMLSDLENGWVSVHRAAHALGLPTLAEMIIGRGEPLAARVSHLETLRAVQRQTGGFVALTISIEHAVSAEARREEEATAADYLKTLAVARLFVPEIEHVQGDWRVQGPKVLGLALRFGADDAGSVEPRQMGGREPRHHGGETELRRIIRDAGFRPVERDALFRQSILH